MNQNSVTKVIALLLFWSILPVSAQQGTVEGIKSTEFQGVQEIENVGFYTVYEEEDQKGKIRSYSLKFLDFNYKETGTEQIELSKIATVSSSANNATHIAIAFSDVKLKQLSIRSFDLQGGAAGSIDIEGSAYQSATIYKSPDGFVVVTMIGEGVLAAKLQFQIIGLDNELKVLWKKELNDETIREVIDVVSTEDATAVVYTSGKGMGKEKYDQHLLRISTDGEVIFDEVFASNYYYFPNKIQVQENNTLIFGSFPLEGKSKPVGVFAIEFDAKGAIVTKSELDYASNIADEIAKLLTEEDLNMKEDPQFIVNDVIKTETGYIVVTETIRLAPAIAVQAEVVVGGGGSSSGVGFTTNTAFHMGDFIVLNLSKDLKIESIQVITKKKNRVVLSGVVFNVNQYHAELKKNSVSNYQFWVENETGKPSIVYTVREAFRSNIKIGVADLNDESKVLRSIEIQSDLEKIKEFSGFGVLKNVDSKITAYVFKKGILSFYDLIYQK